MIPDEICLKYLNMIQSNYVDQEDFYQCFLKATDIVPNKIIESLILTMHEATALNFVSKFISWLTSSYNEYIEVINYRNVARQELIKIREGGM